MFTAVVKNWTDRGFGFATIEGRDDIFIHVSALPDGVEELTPGQRVLLEESTSRDGRRCAANVVIIND